MVGKQSVIFTVHPVNEVLNYIFPLRNPTTTVAYLIEQWHGAVTLCQCDSIIEELV